MPDFKRILLAVDFSRDSEFIGTRAKELAQACGARLVLLHVVVDLKSQWYKRILLSSLSDDVEEQLIDDARKRLEALTQNLGVPDATCVVEVGSPKAGVLKAVEEHDIGLIVVGSHGVGGVDAMLGSTADSILHRSPVDVFVDRLPGEGVAQE